MEHFDDTDPFSTKQVSKTKPFSIFSQLNISKYRRKYPKCTTIQINNILAQDWTRMSLTKRRKYIDIATQHEQDLAAQRANNRAKSGKQNANNNAILTSNFGAIPPNSNVLHQQSSNPNIPIFMNQPSNMVTKGKGKQKRSNFMTNANQRSKNDGDGDYVPQNSSRSVLPAPILDDISNFTDLDPIQEEEESIKLANFTNLCVNLSNPTSTFDCSWYIGQPTLDTNF